MFDLSQILVNT